MIRTSGDDGKHDPVEESVDDTTSLSTGFTYKKKCGGVCRHSSIIREKKVGVGIGMGKCIKKTWRVAIIIQEGTNCMKVLATKCFSLILLDSHFRL